MPSDHTSVPNICDLAVVDFALQEKNENTASYANLIRTTISRSPRQRGKGHSRKECFQLALFYSYSLESRMFSTRIYQQPILTVKLFCPLEIAYSYCEKKQKTYRRSRLVNLSLTRRAWSRWLDIQAKRGFGECRVHLTSSSQSRVYLERTLG